MRVTREAANGRLTCLRRPAPGFTLVELVMVLVLLSVLSAVLAPRWFARQAFDERGYFERTVAALRYSRQLAAAGCPVRFSLTAAGYTVQRPAAFCTSTSFPQAVTDPDGDPLSVAVPTGTTLTGVPLVVTFASDGSTDLAANATVTIGPHALLIHAATGVVEQP